jgi:hypothetical protein
MSPLASMADIELLGRYELLQDELERIRTEIKASMTELSARDCKVLQYHRSPIILLNATNHVFVTPLAQLPSVQVHPLALVLGIPVLLQPGYHLMRSSNKPFSAATWVKRTSSSVMFLVQYANGHTEYFDLPNQGGLSDSQAIQAARDKQKTGELSHGYIVAVKRAR